MALTLSDVKALSQDKLTNYIIDEFRKSAVLDTLPFDDTVKPQGGLTLAYTYNRVTTLPTASTRAINSEYTPQEAKTSQVTVNLKVFGGAFEIDRVLAANEKQVVDLVEFQLAQKIEATRALFHDMFINGDSATDANAFDGIDKAITGSSTELVPSAAIDLSSSGAIDTNWKTFLDALRKLKAKLSSAPSIILMNSDMFAVFQSVMDRAGISLASKENYGEEVVQWGGALVSTIGDKPGTSTPIIGTNGQGETSIYAANLSLGGVHGVSPDANAIINKYLPDMTAPGAVKKGEVEMVAAVALKASRSAGILRKVKVG